MPLYEHVMIARQDLSNTQAEGLIEHFGTVLADNDGKLVDSEYWGVKTMAYKINKNRKGHYAFLRSDAPATAVQEMERLMRLHDDVMRVLTISGGKILAKHMNRADSRGGVQGFCPAYEMRLDINIGVHMPLYEHVMIARQDLSNTQAEGLIEHFGTVLADNDGKLVDSEYWGVKTMAYKINKNRKGHYAFLRSDAPATAVQEMERLMRLHDDVMRVLTI
eukprot:CAMPEP_0184475834 /NCGR_PEP_ID=MMETSP0740-20130409/146774_1 /TAXON_ID=385413 /ORGANISM="Thalassiosira miniscula, Strain CCMP1093" /LENGTH=219 /DNA_ID=CAMNT_0026853375 /DNA_START=133 /DNA_END=789 /DNA_ORIENTATION=-